MGRQSRWRSIINILCTASLAGLIGSGTSEAKSPRYATGLIQPKDFELGVPFLSWDSISEADLPERHDLRELGLLTSIKNQGACGSCWAFAGVAAMESALLKNQSAEFDLSEQELVSCDRRSFGCRGGWQPFDYMIKHGIGAEGDFPYTARSLGCKSIPSQAKALRWGNIGAPGRRATLPEVKKAVVDFGALWITVAANGNWKSNRGGSISNCQNSSVNHAVTVAGYETNADKTNLIIKNSWGTSWGKEGFALTGLGCNNLGSVVSFVVPEDHACAPPEFGLPKVINVTQTTNELRAAGLEESGLPYTWERLSSSRRNSDVISGQGPLKLSRDMGGDYVVTTKTACGTWKQMTRVVSGN